MMRNRSAFQWAAIGALLALVTGTAARAQVGLEPLVEETFRYIKAQWPQAKSPVLTDGDILEVGGGQLRLGRAGLERLLAAPENGSHNVLFTFFAAHEAWHTVQTATMAEADVQRLRSSQVLECEADYMAATITAGRLKALGASDMERLVAGSALSDYVRAHSSGSANAQYYPSAEMRAQTISIAWSYASNPGLVRWAPDPQSPLRGVNSDPGEVMRDICEMAANVHDGSVGNIFISQQKVSPPGAGGGSQQTVPADTQTLSIENFGDEPIIVSYMLVAQGHRRTGAGEKTSREIYDAVRDQIVVSGREKVERRYSMKAYAPAGPGGDFHYNIISTPYATTESGFTFISARYPPGRREYGFCYERINGLDSSSDRALLTRMATVALAAGEDFRPVASKSFVDSGSNRTFKLLGVLQGDYDDRISVRRSPLSQGVLAEIVAFRGKRAADVVAELKRIKQVMALVCEMSNVIPETGLAAAPDLPTYSIRRFAPKAFVQLGAHIYGRGAEGAPPESDRGGYVYFQIARDFSW
ncbi:MAG: hypothetical protein ACXWUQ_00875 [Allosphingosinicella sp.]